MVYSRKASLDRDCLFGPDNLTRIAGAGHHTVDLLGNVAGSHKPVRISNGDMMSFSR